MATEVNIDVKSLTILPKIVPVIGLPYPVSDYSITEKKLLQLLQLPNYVVYEAGTNNVINGTNIENYFPHGGGGGGGTSDYNLLQHQPQINSITLTGNKKAVDLNLMGIPNASTTTKPGQFVTVKSVKNNKIESLDSTDGTSGLITKMTGYTKPSTTSSISTDDTLNQAIGKLEAGISNISTTIELLGADLNEITASGFYRINCDATHNIIHGPDYEDDWNMHPEILNYAVFHGPIEINSMLWVTSFSDESMYIKTTQFMVTDDEIYVRSYDKDASTKWGKWQIMLHDSAFIPTMMWMTDYVKPGATGQILQTDTLSVAIGKLEKGLEGKLNDGNYAASATKGGSASSAVKLDSTNVGSATQGVYIDSTGKPVAMTYTVKTSVPENAVFTDTKYTQSNGISINTENQISNTGVLNFVDSKTADANGTFRANIGGSESTVSIKGFNTKQNEIPKMTKAYYEAHKTEITDGTIFILTDD